MGAYSESGPRTLSTWNSKGKKRSQYWKEKRQRKKTISCKISPVYVGPARVRSWKHDSALSINIFFLHCPLLWEYLVNLWAPLVSLYTWVSTVNKHPRSWEKVTPWKKNWGPESKSDSQNYSPWFFWSFVQGLLHHIKLPKHKKIKGKQKFLQFHPSILLWGGGEYFLA